jgi:hypothetical protein
MTGTMPRALHLEDFTSPAAGPEAAAPPPPADPPEAAIAAYEDGYRNGWDDCARAEAAENRKITADLAANLAAITASHAEARQDVLTALGPLFEEIAAQLLPRLAAEAVAPAVIAELRGIAAQATEARPLLLAAPGALPALERLLAGADGLDIDLGAEPAFAEGQVSIRHAGERRDIDLTGAAERMAEAIRSFVAQETAAPAVAIAPGFSPAAPLAPHPIPTQFPTPEGQA